MALYPHCIWNNLSQCNCETKDKPFSPNGAWKSGHSLTFQDATAMQSRINKVYIHWKICLHYAHYIKSEKEKKNQIFWDFWVTSLRNAKINSYFNFYNTITEKKNIWMWVFKNTQFFSTLFLCWLEKFPWKLGILSWNMHCHHAGFWNRICLLYDFEKKIQFTDR